MTESCGVIIFSWMPQHAARLLKALRLSLCVAVFSVIHLSSASGLCTRRWRSSWSPKSIWHRVDVWCHRGGPALGWAGVRMSFPSASSPADATLPIWAYASHTTEVKKNANQHNSHTMIALRQKKVGKQLAFSLKKKTSQPLTSWSNNLVCFVH